MINEQNIDYGTAEISWDVPEFEKHERPKNWYIGAAIVFILLVIYSLFGIQFWKFDFSQFNPLFFFIIVVSTFIIIMNDGREPANVKVVLTDEGVVVGKKFYDFDEIENFSIVYKPNLGVKNLYFEFKSAVRHRLSLPLLDNDPIEIRNHLLKYLPEDLDRTDAPVSESLSKMLKL
ncbi:MAG: hypothetical protein UT64_C0051G0002 [Candidatus Falkowbacteria bacterium GW2011_GWF2_39_8]|uniref:DUF5673 domain-containing protein n=1 Tax=Candidatus Falkowbacteria bacterium GW2011_GWF2_39_8 TaxID=1618642 RepID=A0A0G0Q328_9BACT|nr:MAG: hypothetical protein UT64_C0051G0002 [Candidatus Falkowbacteria bacterium GW2011_GWF2_39_8]